MENKSLVVSLDFDGTLVRTDHYPIFDPTPLPGCLETLEWLKSKGAKFILLTQRDHTHVAALGRALKVNRLSSDKSSVLQDAIDWCKKNKIELWGINENPGQHYWSDSRKVYSDIIIDDRCACMPLDENNCVDWITLRKALHDKLGN